VSFASLDRVQALPPQYDIGLVGKQARPNRIFIAQHLIEDNLMSRRRRDLPDGQIDQGGPVDVVAKASVTEDLPAA
jgi:hypothetical protein